MIIKNYSTFLIKYIHSKSKLKKKNIFFIYYQNIYTYQKTKNYILKKKIIYLIKNYLISGFIILSPNLDIPLNPFKTFLTSYPLFFKNPYKITDLTPLLQVIKYE